MSSQTCTNPACARKIDGVCLETAGFCPCCDGQALYCGAACQLDHWHEHQDDVLAIGAKTSISTPHFGVIQVGKKDEIVVIVGEAIKGTIKKIDNDEIVFKDGRTVAIDDKLVFVKVTKPHKSWTDKITGAVADMAAAKAESKSKSTGKKTKKKKKAMKKKEEFFVGEEGPPEDYTDGL